MRFYSPYLKFASRPPIHLTLHPLRLLHRYLGFSSLALLTLSRLSGQPEAEFRSCQTSILVLFLSPTSPFFLPDPSTPFHTQLVCAHKLQWLFALSESPLLTHRVHVGERSDLGPESGHAHCAHPLRFEAECRAP